MRSKISKLDLPTNKGEVQNQIRLFSCGKRLELRPEASYTQSITR